MKLKSTDIEGFPEYTINNNGQVYCKKRGKYRKLVPDKNGYLTVNFKKDGKTYCRKAHRLVAEAFIPNYNNYPHVNHIDGNKQNNNVSNLEWTTARHNNIHALETGLRKKGSKYKNNSTGFYGVIKNSDGYTAQIKRGKRNIYLGTYSCPKVAYEVICTELNRELEGRRIRRYKNIKEIYQKDREGNVVNIFSSIAKAEKETGIPNQSIGKVILGKAESAGGFKWERIERKGLFE